MTFFLISFMHEEFPVGAWSHLTPPPPPPPKDPPPNLCCRNSLGPCATTFRGWRLSGSISRMTSRTAADPPTRVPPSCCFFAAVFLLVFSGFILLQWFPPLSFASKHYTTRDGKSPFFLATTEGRSPPLFERGFAPPPLRLS